MKISQTEWRLGHTFGISTPADVYYTKLANRVYDQIRFTNIDPRFTEFDLHEIALLITYYFEDVISDIGIWRTFVTTHKELFGSYLPFYEIDEEQYLLDEINPQDISFLLWMGVQRHNENTMINPENPGLSLVAMQIYNMFDAEFEKAPINTELVREMLHPRHFADFFLLKEWCCQLYTGFYLLQDPEQYDHEEEMEDDLKNFFGQNESMLSYTVRSILSINSKMGPLAMTIPQWMTRLLKLKGMEREAEIVASIECMPVAIYLLKEYDAEVLTLEGVAGDVFKLARDSFGDLQDMTLQTCKVLIVSLVHCSCSPYWQVCGGSVWLLGDEAFYEMRNEKQQQQESQIMVRDKLLAANDNHPLFYFRDYKEMKQFFATHVGIADEFVDPDVMEEQNLIAVFMQSDGQLAIIPDQAVCIKDLRNPYYNSQKADSEAVSLLFVSTLMPSEAACYLVEHDMLPDARINSLYGPERGRQLVQENIGFWLRFCRKWRY